MKFHRTLLLILTLAATLPSITLAAEMPGDFAQVREIEIQGDRSTDRMPTVPFDASVYLSTHDNYPDLRVFDEQNRAVPFVIEITTAGNTTATESFEIAKEKFKATEDASRQTTEITFDTDRRHVSFKELSEENLHLRFSETRADRLKLVIENGDNPPIDVIGLTAAGPTHRVSFLAEAGHDYRLAYGSSNAQSPKYDTTAIHRVRMAGMQPSDATLGAIDESAEPSRRPTEPAVRRWLRDRRVVIGIIAFMVVLLTITLIGAAARARKAEGGEEKKKTEGE